jgi:hypothetical protein
MDESEFFQLMKSAKGDGKLCVLLIAESGDIKEGQVDFLTNATRADMISMLHKILARLEGPAASDAPPSETPQ